MNQVSLVVRGVMALFVTFLLLSATPMASAQNAPIPEFTSWVTDTTNTLSAPVEARLTQKLAALDREKGAQIAVLMIPTTQNESIESYATRAFAQWQLGRKDVDDGILLVVAKDDRRLRIEVGYGLEGAVPDVLAGRIIREQITPRFRTGQFTTGVIAGVDSLIALVQGETLPPPNEGSESRPQGDNWSLLLALAFMAIIMPLGMPTLFIGVFAAIGFGSVLMGIASGVGAAFLGVLVRRLGFGNTRQTIAASRRGGGRLGRASKYGAGGFAAGAGGGFGGGGMGGGVGGGGGGGGGSGGGGASGSW